MTRPTKHDWTKYEREILEKIDILAEWKSIGLRLASDSPNAKGWVKCHSINREDNTPSAGVCVQGEGIGLYNDFAMGASGMSSLFKEIGAKKHGGDWRAARDEYANRFGIKKPEVEEKGADKHGMESFVPTCGHGVPTEGQYELYCDRKHGVSRQALIDVGAIAGQYPKNWVSKKTATYCFAFPMWSGEALHEGPPCGIHLVSIDPKKMIRHYDGKGNPAKESKTISRGKVGILNLQGLRDLETASVVWWVEGISDCLAVQSIIPRDGKQCVLSMTGCGVSIPSKILHKFAGKTHYVCYDVGDKNNAGQDGAVKNCELLSSVAKEVRNVILPVGTDGGKHDLRDWIHSGKRTYADMMALANLCPVFLGSSAVTPDRSEEPAVSASSAHQRILDSLGCVVSGQVEGTNGVEIHSVRTNQRMILKSLNTFSLHEAAMLFGGDVALSVISQNREPEKGKVSLSEVRLAIACAACGKVVSDSDAVGCGLWELGGEIVLVGKSFAHHYTRSGELLRIQKPTYAGKRFDYSSHRDWYEEEQMREMLSMAKNTQWRKSVVEELHQLFCRWDNWEFQETNPKLAAGLVLATWAQTLWRFRPHVCVTGPTSSGKSWLVEKALRGVFNGLGTNVVDPSEAGICQEVGNTSVIVIIDEFDRAKYRKEVLSLLRTATDGNRKIRSNNTNTAVKNYGLKHIGWCAGIESGITEEADQNRFIRLTLTKVPEDRDPAARLELPAMLALKDLGHRLSAVAIYSIREAREIAEKITSLARPDGVNKRYIEGLAVPVSMLAVNYGWSAEDAAMYVEQLAIERKISSRQTSDEEDLIEAIQGSKTTEAGRQHTISSLIHSVVSDVPGANWDFDPNTMVRAIDADRMLQANGVRVLREEGFFFIHPREVTRFLLQNTRFSIMSIGDILERIPGASRARRRISNHPKKGILIPLSAIYEDFADKAT